ADAVIDLAREAMGRALGGTASRVDRQRQRDLAARARVLLQVLLVAALEAGHVRALDLREHDIGRQRRLVERLLVGNRDPACRRVLAALAPAGALDAAGTVDVRALAGADARITVAARATAGAAADRDGLAAFLDVGDLLAEVGARATLGHVALAVAVRA